MKEGLKFISLEVENFKNIDKRIVEINGRSFIISAKNGAGKSSLIQALLSPLDSKSKPLKPIKNGEEKASTRVVIGGTLHGEEEEYTLDMYFTPGNNKGRLVVKNSKGETMKAPTTMLKEIVGDISFDIFRFLNDSKANKIKVLKELSGVSKEIFEIDEKRKVVYDSRAFTNRKVDEMSAQMKDHELSQDDIDKYQEEIDISELQEEMANISKKISDYNGVKSKTEGFIKAVEKNEEEIEALELKIQGLMEANNVMADNIVKGEAWLKTHPEPSAEKISDKLNLAMEHNANHRKVAGLIAKNKELNDLKKKAVKLDEEVKAFDKEKETVISKSKLPVKGLTFDEDEIYLNGLPLEEGQINTAKLIDVGLEISMALNPNLKVVFLHEGSLLDQESLDLIIKKVEKKGYQLIAEVVSNEADISIEFTETEV